LYRETCVEIDPTHSCGKFHASGNPASRVPKEVFEVITLLGPRFHRVSLIRVSYDVWRDYWPLVEECAGSLEELFILANGAGKCQSGLISISDSTCRPREFKMPTAMDFRWRAALTSAKSSFHWVMKINLASLSRSASPPSQAPSFPKCPCVRRGI